MAKHSIRLNVRIKNTFRRMLTQARNMHYNIQQTIHPSHYIEPVPHLKYVNQMTNWQRNQWTRNGRNPENAKAFAMKRHHTYD